MRNAVLSLIAISLIACEKLPPYPEVWNCGYSIKFDFFFCVNNKTNDEIVLKRDDPRMERSQCLSEKDYEAGQQWVETLKQMAERRCR